MDVSMLLLAIVLGAVAGSIINMLASRLPATGDPPAIGLPLRPASETPDALALVPLAGAWMPSMRAIDWPKLATELAALLVTTIALLRYDDWLVSLRAAVFALILLLILRIDWQNHLIFSITIAPAILLAFVLHALDSLRALAWSVGAAVGAALLFLLLYFLALAIYRRRALGFGDVLLAALIGAMTGQFVVAALIFGMLLAAVGGLFLIAIRVRKRTDYIPYGAYLCLGAIIVVL
jgi:leader peptidase (prepilin peptidase) / N-methyltransferase